MASNGFWAWIPDLLPSRPADNQSTQTNTSHAQGRTDSYRPSYHDDLIRNGIVPPPRGSGSGSRVFRSARRDPPAKGRANRVSKPGSKKNSPAKSTRPKKPTPPRASNKKRRLPARLPNGRFAKKEPVPVKASSPPPNAPKAPIADRIRDMESLFSNLDVTNTPLPAHRAPFLHHISSTLCTNHLCPIAQLHWEGLYLHEGRIAPRPHNYFGATNPPPWLWEAYDRVERSEGSEMDFVNLQYFISCHEPYFELCKEEFWE